MLKGKIIVNFGDSIFGNFRAPEDISTYIAEETGATVYNVGFGGCRMAKHALPQFGKFSMYMLADAITDRDFSGQHEAFSYEPIGEALPLYFIDSLELLESIDFENVDAITIAYGTNDFTAIQALDSPDKYDINSFGGALRYSIEKIKNRYPKIKIAVCSQLYRYWHDENNKFVEDSETKVFGDRKLSDFIEKTKEIADEYGLFYINNYDESGINAETRTQCFSASDGAHPLEYGRRLIASNMSKNLAKIFADS
jgi:lysophospholipase L1-like esterase